jgi:hypothetical protein
MDPIKSDPGFNGRGLRLWVGLGRGWVVWLSEQTAARADQTEKKKTNQTHEFLNYKNFGCI